MVIRITVRIKLRIEKFKRNTLLAIMRDFCRQIDRIRDAYKFTEFYWWKLVG